MSFFIIRVSRPYSKKVFQIIRYLSYLLLEFPSQHFEILLQQISDFPIKMIKIPHIFCLEFLNPFPRVNFSPNSTHIKNQVNFVQK